MTEPAGETGLGLPSDDEDDLVAESWEARERAYAPYSNFLVGAALRTPSGVFTGANVENASYGLAICAERVAAVTAVAAGVRDFEVCAVTSSAMQPAPPCGACRQFLYEFNPSMVVVSEGRDGERKRWRLSDLLLDGFGPEDLESAGSAG
jgi:cytidine deaminase